MMKKQINIISKYCKKLVSNRMRCMNCGSEMFAVTLSDYDDSYSEIKNPYAVIPRYIFKRKTKYFKALKNRKAKLNQRKRGVVIPNPKQLKYKILCMCEKCEKYDTYRGASAITIAIGHKFER